MNPIRLLALFLLLLLTALPARAAFNACATDARQHYLPIEGHYGRHLLFELVRCGTPPSYVLGTYHSDAPKVYKTVLPAVGVLKQSDLAVFEYLQPKDADAIVLRTMYFPDGGKENLRDLLGPARFAKLKAAFHQKFPNFREPMLARLQPWAAAVLLQYPAQHFDGIVLDDRFKLLAEQLHKPQAGLETLQDQLDIFTDLTQAQQLSMLNDALDYGKQSAEIEHSLRDAYLDHDLARIESLVPESVALTHDAAFTHLLMNRLLYQRNHAMVEAALPLLSKGHAFIAVGALHLPGDTGLLRKFEENGYFVLPAD
jgi:uncharacterized protein YbaP (TraB family)